MKIKIFERTSYTKYMKFQYTGTVSTTATGTSITGSGTSFTTELNIGDWVQIGSGTNAEIRPVATPSTNTAVGVTTAFVNTHSGVPMYIAYPSNISDQPYNVSSFQGLKGIIDGYFNFFGNTDNFITMQIQWGMTQEGQYPFISQTGRSSDTLFWVTDPILVKTIQCGATTSTIVPIQWDIGEIKAPYMSILFTGAGTLPTVGGLLYLQT